MLLYSFSYFTIRIDSADSSNQVAFMHELTNFLHVHHDVIPSLESHFND